MICSLEGREKSLYCNGWGGFRDFHISDMDKSRRISLLNTFSKTREAKSVVPIASLMAFNSCASFFRFAISSTDYKHNVTTRDGASGDKGQEVPLDASAV